MMAERHMLVSAKADRESDLVKTLIQLSSAALFLIPAIISGRDVSVPRFQEAVMFYIGIVALVGSLLCAVAEQHTSSKAYSCQIETVFKYYCLDSEEVSHPSGRIVRWLRTSSFLLFVAGIIMSAFGVANMI